MFTFNYLVPERGSIILNYNIDGLIFFDQFDSFSMSEANKPELRFFRSYQHTRVFQACCQFACHFSFSFSLSFSFTFNPKGISL